MDGNNQTTCVLQDVEECVDISLDLVEISIYLNGDTVHNKVVCSAWLETFLWDVWEDTIFLQSKGLVLLGLEVEEPVIVDFDTTFPNVVVELLF